MQLVKEASAVVLKLPRMVALRAEGRGIGLGRSWLERTGKKVSMDVDGRHVLCIDGQTGHPARHYHY
jgi:hypothetical protein